MELVICVSYSQYGQSDKHYRGQRVIFVSCQGGEFLNE